MSDWKFLKKPEFLVTTIIAILLTFVGGFFAGQSYVINGDFAELQNEYSLLNSTYQKNCMVNSPDSVQSVNQQGGITARDINIESPKREIDDQFIRKLNQFLPESKEEVITVTSVMGDSEALQFAKELKQYLESLGYNVNGIDQAVYGEPIIGTQVQLSPLEFIVGTKP